MYTKLKLRTEEVLLQILSLIAEKEKEICSKEKDDDSKSISVVQKKKTPIIKKKKKQRPWPPQTNKFPTLLFFWVNKKWLKGND